MRRLSKIVPILAALGGLALAGTPEARAGLLPSAPVITSEGSNFRWTYTIFVPAFNSVQTGDFFTIYDFQGFKPLEAVTEPPGWSLTSANTGTTAPQVNANDNASQPNLTFHYDGPTLAPGPNSSASFSVSAVSSFDHVTNTQLSSLVHRDYDGALEASITTAIVPVPSPGGPGPGPSDTPEPATLVMLGVGLPLLGAAGLLRRRKAAAAI